MSMKYAVDDEEYDAPSSSRMRGAALCCFFSTFFLLTKLEKGELSAETKTERTCRRSGLRGPKTTIDLNPSPNGSLTRGEKSPLCRCSSDSLKGDEGRKMKNERVTPVRVSEDS